MLYGLAAFVHNLLYYEYGPLILLLAFKNLRKAFFPTARKLRPALMNNLNRELFLELVMGY